MNVSLIDGEFSKLLLIHLRQTHDFDGFRQWVTEVLAKKQNQHQIILAQLEEIKIRQEAIMDERLGIRTQINQPIRTALAEDSNLDVEQMKSYYHAKRKITHFL